jgi:hypothetical protein
MAHLHGVLYCESVIYIVFCYDAVTEHFPRHTVHEGSSTNILYRLISDQQYI